jgi:hypothetical protein
VSWAGSSTSGFSECVPTPRHNYRAPATQQRYQSGNSDARRLKVMLIARKRENERWTPKQLCEMSSLWKALIMSNVSSQR